VGRIIPNPAVSSSLSQGCWLRLRWEKHPATFPVFGIPPSKFHHLSIHQHYSQKIREGGSLDLFTEQNPAVASTHPYDSWLSLAIENILPLSDFRNSAQQISPPVDTSTLQSGDLGGWPLRAIRRAESSRGLRSSIQPLVVTLPLKTFSHFLIFGILPSKLHHLLTHQQLLSEDS